MPKTRTFRTDLPLPPEARIYRQLTDGPALTRHELQENAKANHEVYGYWGVSVFSAISDEDDDELMRGKLRRALKLAVFMVGALATGLVDALPSGQHPHQDLAILTLNGPAGADGDLAVLLDRIMAVPHNLMDNRYYSPEGGRQ